jgi:hypothetical protein
MTLKPTDMLAIQTAIDEYERKYPRRPVPSAEEALAWRMGKRSVRRSARQASDPVLSRVKKASSEFAEQECNRFVWAWEQIRLQWHLIRVPQVEPALAEDLLPWVKGALRIGWWGMVAVVTASIFFFGAIVGGYK